MKVDANKHYKCKRCSQQSFVYDKFFSRYSEEYMSHVNTATGKCLECGWVGEFTTANKEKRYEATV